MRTRRFPVLVLVLLAAVLAAPAVHTQSTITPPQFTVGGKTYTAGDDYFQRTTPSCRSTSPKWTRNPIV